MVQRTALRPTPRAHRNMRARIVAVVPRRVRTATRWGDRDIVVPAVEPSVALPAPRCKPVRFHRQRRLAIPTLALLGVNSHAPFLAALGPLRLKNAILLPDMGVVAPVEVC